MPQQFQYVDTVALQRWGAQSLRFGADVRAPMRNIYQDEASTRGTLEFSGQYTGGTNSYADALIGYVRAGHVEQRVISSISASGWLRVLHRTIGS